MLTRAVKRRWGVATRLGSLGALEFEFVVSLHRDAPRRCFCAILAHESEDHALHFRVLS